MLVFFLVVSARAETALDSALARAKAESWGRDAAWLRLLHYRRGVLGNFAGGVGDDDFYLSPRGRKDPEAELLATLAAFIDPEKGAENLCRFPARAKWLAREKGVDLPAADCERYDAWLEKLNPSGVSVIFAAYYFNNPASMYGHTFIKLDRAGQENSELLHYTVNYAAVTDTSNGVMFALRGLLGLYEGRFATDPFYIKIQKYNNMESRDLWEYRLNFSTDEIDTFARHLWELGPHGSPYFFFNRNCSYELLPLLEVAKPDWHLSRPFQYRAIPLDTLRRVIEAPGALKEVKFRPSHGRRLMARASLLTNEELRRAKALSRGGNQILPGRAESPVERNALVLDTALDLWRLRAGFARDLPPAQRDIERRLLLARKDIDAPPLAVDVIPGDRPEEGHGSLQMSMSFGADRRKPFGEVGLRSVLHDLNSSPRGFVPGSELEMFAARLRYHSDEGKVSLREMRLVRILSLSPRNRVKNSPSWAVEAAARTPEDFESERRGSFSINGGSGLAWSAGEDRLLTYAMGAADAASGPMFRKGYRTGAGVRAGAWLAWSEKSRLNAGVTGLRYFAGNISYRLRWEATQTFDMTKKTECRFSVLADGHAREGRITWALNL